MKRNQPKPSKPGRKERTKLLAAPELLAALKKLATLGGSVKQWYADRDDAEALIERIEKGEGA